MARQAGPIPRGSKLNHLQRQTQFVVLERNARAGLALTGSKGAKLKLFGH